jgi:Flp pilus assembly protein TadB
LLVALLSGLAGGAAAAAALRPVAGSPPGAPEPGAWYRPLLDRLARRVQAEEAARTSLLLRIAGAGGARDGAEHLARVHLRASAWGVAVAAAAAFAAGWPAAAAGALVYLTYRRAKAHELARWADARIKQLKARLPFAADLLAAQLAAGAGLPDAIRVTATELAGHPAGDEFAVLGADLDRGLSLAESLRGSAVFQGDAELRALAAEIIRAERDGVKVADTFRLTAAELRQRATQWAEAAAERAKSHMVFPVVLVAIASMAVMTAPFVLDVLRQL